MPVSRKEELEALRSTGRVRRTSTVLSASSVNQVIFTPEGDEAMRKAKASAERRHVEEARDGLKNAKGLGLSELESVRRRGVHKREESSRKLDAMNNLRSFKGLTPDKFRKRTDGSYVAEVDGEIVTMASGEFDSLKDKFNSSYQMEVPQIPQAGKVWTRPSGDTGEGEVVEDAPELGDEKKVDEAAANTESASVESQEVGSTESAEADEVVDTIEEGEEEEDAEEEVVAIAEDATEGETKEEHEQKTDEKEGDADEGDVTEDAPQKEDTTDADADEQSSEIEDNDATKVDDKEAVSEEEASTEGADEEAVTKEEVPKEDDSTEVADKEADVKEEVSKEEDSTEVVDKEADIAEGETSVEVSKEEEQPKAVEENTAEEIKPSEEDEPKEDEKKVEEAEAPAEEQAQENDPLPADEAPQDETPAEEPAEEAIVEVDNTPTAERIELTKKFYDEHVNDYIANVENCANIHVPDAHRETFLQKLAQSKIGKDGRKKFKIVDLGCGYGRDANYFSLSGHRVLATDFSRPMIGKAAEVAPDAHCLVMDMRDIGSHFVPKSLDGVWACASIVHLPKGEVPAVLGAVRDALRSGGILYVSAKEGTDGETFESDARYGGVKKLYSYYESKELEEMLVEAGFEGVEMGGNDNRGKDSYATHRFLHAFATKA